MPNLVVVGAQWGDEGKGKIVDLLSEDADAVIRYQGGNNAGHTVVFRGQRHVLHLIPCGILHPDKLCLIGNGVVIDPISLLDEIQSLKEAGVKVGDNLKISELAPVTLPYHRELDKAYEVKLGKEKIETTHRGIGPTYRDKYGRVGVRIIDLLDRNRLRRALERSLDEKNFIFQNYFSMAPFKMEDLLLEYTAFGEQLKPYVDDTAVLANQLLDDDKRVLFEGAQGTFLDVDFGTYPFVTASHPIAGGASIGVGVGPTRLNEVLGIVKAYTTRVGAGPMPSEMEGGGEDLRRRGKEYGATTGRPRRCGWFDAIVVRRARMLNGFKRMALTKLDVLNGLPEIKICIGYRVDGKSYDSLPAALDVIEKIEPIYEEHEGWQLDEFSAIQRYDALPQNAKKYISRIEELVGAQIALISVGEDRTQTIIRQPLFAH